MDQYTINYIKANPSRAGDMIKRLNIRKKECMKMRDPRNRKECVKFQNKMIEEVKRKVKELAKENTTYNKKSIVESFLQFLYTDKRAGSKEWRGANIPYGDDSNRPNLIRACMTLESNRMKINCLRKLRDQAAMNPFYQARLDRFVDAVTGIYEPTNKPGTIPGNEFKATAVGDDLKEGKIIGHLKGAPEVTKWISAVKMNDNYYLGKVDEACKKQPFGKRKKCRILGEIKVLENTLKNLEKFMKGNVDWKDHRNGCKNPLLDKQVCIRMFTWEINRVKKRILKLKGKL